MLNWVTRNSKQSCISDSSAGVCPALESVGTLLGFIRNPKLHYVNCVGCAKVRFTP